MSRIFRNFSINSVATKINSASDTSDEFEEEIESWEEEGLYLKFLPPYCQKSNLIEILWRKIKCDEGNVDRRLIR
jgi:transposase